MLLPWIVCGLIIFASTLVFLKKKTGGEIAFNNELLLSMIVFAIMGPTAIFMGSIVINDFRN